MAISLRNYQQDVITKTRQAMLRHKNILLQLPTGGGKTVIASFMAESASSKQGRVFFICHRRELVDQTSLTFRNAGIDHGFIAAGYRPNPFMPVNICSIDTLKNRLDRVQEPTLCIWDEAHHLGAAGWARVHEHYSNAWHVGLSATPERLDGRGLDQQFDSIVRGPSVSWLIDEGYLANYKLFSVPGVDMTGVHTRMGDYVKSETEAAMDKPKITGNIVRHWQKHAADKLTIAFAVSVKHSQHLCDQFRSQGIMALHLDGKTAKEDRRQALRAFARGDVRVICNVGLFGEGFDAAANSGMDVTVGCVIDAAPTKSLGAWLQRCGRALRPQRTPAIILDHGGNALRHGLPCDEREWTLAGREKRAKAEESEIAIKQCDQCFAVHRPAPKCPNCGHVYEVQHREIEQVDGELQEMDVEELRRARKREQGQAQSFEALVALGKQRGYKNPAGWARHVFNSRVGKKFSRGAA